MIGSNSPALKYAKPAPRFLEKNQQRLAVRRLQRMTLEHVRKRDKACRCCGKRPDHTHHVKMRSRHGLTAWDVKQMVRLCTQCHRLCHLRHILVTCRNAEKPDGVTFRQVQG